MTANTELSAAIARHKAASAAIKAHAGSHEVPTSLVDAETAALRAISGARCTDDAEFFDKLSYMLSVQKLAYGQSYWAGSCVPEILTAIDLHLAGKRAGECEEEFEELDIAEKLRRPESRLIALCLAIGGVALPKETIGALLDLIHDARADLEQLAHDLEQQDKAKRARGEPHGIRTSLAWRRFPAVR